jgi:hypothetical protein
MSAEGRNRERVNTLPQRTAADAVTTTAGWLSVEWRMCQSAVFTHAGDDLISATFRLGS